MSGYQRINFKDQNVERPKTYDVTNNPDGSITLIESFGNVEELGTPINQENMNHIEDGIDAVSFSKFNIDSTYKKDDLITEIQDGELKIFKSLKDNNFGHLPSESDYWEEVEISGGGGGAGLQMFDTVLKDHILTYEESEGLALQGTYVYKTAIAGERFGYPDFYAKCLEEYQGSETITEVKEWTQPILTANGTLGGDSFAVSAVNEQYPAFRCFASDRNTAETACWQSNTQPASYTIYNPIALNITNIKITNKTSYVRAIASGKVLGSNDNATWEQITTFANTNNNAGVSWNIDLSNNTKFFKYYKLDSLTGLEASFVAIGGMDITAITSSFSYLKNPNGHRFYPISRKAEIDDIYNKYGVADFYGIDEENERIFLPRNKHFFQLTDDPAKVNQMMKAGSPNITGNLVADAYASIADASTGAFKSASAVDSQGMGSGHSQVGKSISFDASRSSEVYGNSDTVQPPSSLKLLYYCVGNTVSSTSWMDVVTQVEGGVKDLEDATNEGIERLKASSNALTTTQITNCITEVPQRIKYDLTDGILTIKAGSQYIVPYGTQDLTADFPIGSTFLHENYKVADTQFDGTKFFVWAEFVNDASFTTGQTGGLECAQFISFGTGTVTNKDITKSIYSGTTAPTKKGSLFYNTSTNFIHQTTDTAGTLDGVAYSLPITIAILNEQKYETIKHVFNGMGYMGSSLWVDKKTKYLIADDKNEDGTLKNIEKTRSNFIIRTLTAGNGEYIIGLNDEFSIITHKRYSYNKTQNRNYLETGDEWKFCPVGTCTLTDGVISNFAIKQPFRAVDYNDVAGLGMPSEKYIDLTVGASGTAYIAPADGYFSMNTLKPSAGQVVLINLTTKTGASRYVPNAGTSFVISTPARKGDSVTLAYDNTLSISGATAYFTFVYAEGEL